MLKQLIEEKITEILLGDAPKETPKPTTEADFMGKNVLIRAHMMGVQVGTVTCVTDTHITLSNSRKLWRWAAIESVALESLVKNGVDKNRTRATTITNSVTLLVTDCVGIIELPTARHEEIMGLEATEQD